MRLDSNNQTAHPMRKVPIRIIFITLLVLMTQHQAEAQDSRIKAVARLVAKVSNGIGASALHSTNIKWDENQEVKLLSKLTAYQRAAAIYALIDYTTENESTQLPFRPNDLATAAINLGTRQISLAYISSLASQTDSENYILNFIKSEITDIQLTLDAQISYGQYFRARLSRDEIRKSVVEKNKPIADAVKKTKAKKQNFIRDLAAKTTSLSLMQFCTKNLDICSSAPE